MSLQVHQEHIWYVSVLLISKLGSCIQISCQQCECDPSNRECMMHNYTNCPETSTLHKFLEDEIDPYF